MIASTDPIADMLTRIRNALMRHHTDVTIPHSQIKEQILKIFLRYKFIADFKVVQSDKFKVIEVELTSDQQPISPITNLKRLSRPGRRLYVDKQAIPWIKNGRGLVILSTDQGLMTGRKAKKARLGGEVLCSIY